MKKTVDFRCGAETYAYKRRLRPERNIHVMYRMLRSEKNPDENNNNNNNNNNKNKNNGKKTKESKKKKFIALQFILKVVCEAMENSPSVTPSSFFPNAR